MSKVRVWCDYYGPGSADWNMSCAEHNVVLTTWGFEAALEAALGHLCMTHKRIA